MTLDGKLGLLTNARLSLRQPGAYGSARVRIRGNLRMVAPGMSTP